MVEAEKGKEMRWRSREKNGAEKGSFQRNRKRPSIDENFEVRDLTALQNRTW